LILAGVSVLFTGLAIALFKELNIPRYGIPDVVGVALIGAGMIVRGIRRKGNGSSQHKS